MALEIVVQEETSAQVQSLSFAEYVIGKDQRLIEEFKRIVGRKVRK